MANYTVNNDGLFFTVYIYDDYVLKVPKRDEVKSIKKLQFIADTQTYLSTKIEGVLPSKRIDDHLIQPKAPGVRLDKIINEDVKFYKGLIRKMKKKIEDLGYKLKDTSKRNFFYDKDSGILYMIDMHGIEKKGR